MKDKINVYARYVNIVNTIKFNDIISLFNSENIR